MRVCVMEPLHILSVGDTMKKYTWKVYALWIVLTEAVGGLSGWLSRDGMELYMSAVRQPPLSPPGWVFPVVWAILYALMGIGAARIWLAPASNARSRGLLLYIVQLAFNFFWSIIFFNLQNFGLAFIWLAALWLLILWMILTFRRVDKPAALIQLPYLIWTAFALYLNLGVWLLNR